MMNTTQILDNLSQESLFAIGIFGFALLFYMTRLVNSLKNKISLYEEAELSGKESLERDVLIMNGMIDDLRVEFTSLQKGLEDELVAHEVSSTSLNPRFKKIELLISNTLDKQSDTLIDLNRKLNALKTSVSTISLDGPNVGIETMNEILPRMIQKVKSLDESAKGQSSFVNEMQRDLQLVKRACGVE